MQCQRQSEGVSDAERMRLRARGVAHCMRIPAGHLHLKPRVVAGEPFLQFGHFAHELRHAHFSTCFPA
jgi:hypothetical protein